MTDRTVTVVGCRPFCREDFAPAWTRRPICRLHCATIREERALSRRDGTLDSNEYGLVDPTPHLDELID